MLRQSRQLLLTGLEMLYLDAAPLLLHSCSPILDLWCADKKEQVEISTINDQPLDGTGFLLRRGTLEFAFLGMWMRTL